MSSPGINVSAAARKRLTVENVDDQRKMRSVSNHEEVKTELQTTTYEDYLRQKLEGKKGCRATLNHLVSREASAQRKKSNREHSTGSLEESRTSVRSGGSRPPVFIKQV